MVTDVDMCRCCGQITDRLKDMNQHFLVDSNLKLIEWFFMFTNLDIKTFCQKYTKICKICELKLRQAHEFRQECLTSEIEFLKEANAQNIEFSSFTKEEYTDEKLTQEILEMLADAEQNSVNFELDCILKRSDIHQQQSSDQQKTEELIEEILKLPARTVERDSEPDNKSDTKHCNSPPPLKKTQTDIQQRQHSEQQITTCKIKKIKTDPTKAILFTCSYCDVSFHQKHRLQIHMISHSNEHPFNCIACNKKFKTQAYLNRHIKTYGIDHKPIKKPIQPTQSLLCGVCGATFTTHVYLKKHSLVHSEKSSYSYSCTLCNKAFKSQQHLNRHIGLHSPTKNFKCEICHKKYKSRPGLAVHKMDHFEDKKKHSCPICDEKFATKTYLKYHLDRHTNTFPYQCNLCENKYRRVHAFNNHFRIVHENKRFPCQDCSIEFKTNVGLKFHILLKHQGAKLICDVCSMEFTYKKAIVRHLKKSHKSGFNQSVHFVLPSKERVRRSEKLQCSIIQTEKQQPDEINHSVDIEEVYNNDMHIMEQM